MLRQLTLENFRCFERHSVTFERNTVVVGKNNAGKSSIIEALQLIAALVNRKSATFVAPPDSLDLPDFRACIQPSVAHLSLGSGTVFHRYGDPPAVVAARFDEDTTVTAYVSSPGTVHGTFQSARNWITSARQLGQLRLPWIYVLPQISPLQTEEHEKSDVYVEDNLFSDLSSRHFRNQLNRHRDEFAEFKRLAESTWPGLKVDPVERRIQKKGTFLGLSVRDGDFVGEVGLMGHGLQMWLQMIWFISRVPPGSIIVLDEPDVYMHPDLQRKLFRLIAGRFPQTIVATHSIEIMAEADPSEILVVDKRKRRSRFANSEPAVQLLIDQIGGVHNVHLARLWSARKFLLLEGEDMALLRRFHAVLYPEADLPLDALPSLSIGGWTGWPRAIGSSLAMKNAVGDRIVSYCILDRDYHTDAEVAERLNEAEKAGVNLHVWTHKEIENLLLNPNSIRRVIARRAEPKRVPSVPELWDQIQCICDQFKDTVIDGLASEIQKRDRIDLVGAIRRAREKVLSTWSDPAKRIVQVPGKEVLGRLSEWSQKTLGVAFGAPAIAAHMTEAEIPDEVKTVIEAIESGQPFGSQ